MSRHMMFPSAMNPQEWVESWTVTKTSHLKINCWGETPNHTTPQSLQLLGKRGYYSVKHRLKLLYKRKKSTPSLYKWRGAVIKNPSHSALVQDRFIQLTIQNFRKFSFIILKYQINKYFFIISHRYTASILTPFMICISVNGICSNASSKLGSGKSLRAMCSLMHICNRLYNYALLEILPKCRAADLPFTHEYFYLDLHS